MTHNLANHKEYDSTTIFICLITFMVFAVLQLCGVISWPIWTLTAPLWGPVAATLVYGVLGALLFE